MVLLRAAGHNVSGLRPNKANPFLHRLDHQLEAIIEMDTFQFCASCWTRPNFKMDETVGGSPGIPSSFSLSKIMLSGAPVQRGLMQTRSQSFLVDLDGNLKRDHAV